MPYLLSLLAAFGFLFSTATLVAGPDLLPPLPPPSGMLEPAPQTDGPYAPRPLIPGGRVIPLYALGAPELRPDRIHEPERYGQYSPPQIGYITHIHNPSIEFHPGHGQFNTGAVIILAAGGGHEKLGVGGEAIPLVSFFAHQGIHTAILRNRLRSDGYEPTVDGAGDMMQAIKILRAYAKELNIDPARIGALGFSAGAELVALASLEWESFDRTQAQAGSPFSQASARLDFAGLIYPGPSPFSRGLRPAIPRAMTPTFIATPGWGDRVHAEWATDYFTALLRDGVPNVEFHVYARGHHPGDAVSADEPAAGSGLANMGGIAWGTWSARYLDWLRDLGFTGKPGQRTRAAVDVERQVLRTPRAEKL